MNRELRRELLVMHTLDEKTLERAAADDPRIESLHRKNAARLAEILDEAGWPGRSLVGEAGMRAAWHIAQNAINDLDFQRRALVLLKGAVARDDAPAWQAAMLEDRICRSEGRPQVYGTQPDWPVADEENLQKRRVEAGLLISR